MRCSILRGGTSRAIFFLANDLPPERERRSSRCCSTSSAARTSARSTASAARTSQTSKAAIIGPPSRADADVDYTFAQVERQRRRWSTGVATAATSRRRSGRSRSTQGWSAPTEPIDHRPDPQHQHRQDHPRRTSRSRRRARRESMALRDPGRPGTGARILLDFTDPAGSVTGKLLPTGNPSDELDARRRPGRSRSRSSTPPTRGLPRGRGPWRRPAPSLPAEIEAGHVADRRRSRRSARSSPSGWASSSTVRTRRA